MAGTILDFNTAKRQGDLAKGIVDADDIRERLHGDARSFVEWLFSGRAYIGKNGIARIGDTAGTPGESLSIHLTGPNAGLWKDHATDEGGDLIELYRAYRGYRDRSNFMLSLKEIAKEFLGDPVEIERATWAPSVSQFIAEKKAKLGDKPRADTLELGAPVATYTYYDTRGNVLAAVKRFEPDGTRESKTFRPYCFRTIEGVTKWMPGAPDLRPLYRIPDIALSQTVVLCEGEGCADALVSLGIAATSAMQGANAPIDKTDWSPLAGKTVIIWPDNDAPGFQYARSVADRLSTMGCTVLGVTPPEGSPDKWDAADCVAEGGDAHRLIAGASVVGTSHESGPFLDSVQFVERFQPKSFLLKGIIEESRLYTMTGPTGTGKTAIALLIGMNISLGRMVGNLKTKQTPVLFLAGENPDDVRTRYIAMLEQAGLQASEVPMYFREGFFSVEGQYDIISNFIKEHKPGLVIVDTLQAFFDGDDSNSNEQMKKIAQVFRAITRLGPAVVIPAHPKKAPTRDTNEPYGGGALVNEIDGNLALWGDPENVELYWCKKFRGAFDPINFSLSVGPLRDHVDADGDPVVTVTAKAISDKEAASISDGQMADEDVLLEVIGENSGASWSSLAAACFQATGDTAWSKRKVQKVIGRLHDDKLVRKYRSHYVITEAGKEALSEVRKGRR